MKRTLMSLSEHEQRILAEIERELAREDPRFVQRARRVSERADRRLWLAGAGFVLGLVCLFGLTFNLVWGVIGFAIMFASVVFGAKAIRDRDLTRRFAARSGREGPG